MMILEIQGMSILYETSFVAEGFDGIEAGGARSGV